VDLATVLATTEPVLEFADRRLKRGIEAVGARFAADDWTSPAGRDLDVLAVLALTPVLLVIELDVEELDGAIEALEARQLFGDVCAEVIGDLDVSALDDDLGAKRDCGFVIDRDHRRMVGVHGLG
jgi:hypothetical protein